MNNRKGITKVAGVAMMLAVFVVAFVSSTSLTTSYGAGAPIALALDGHASTSGSNPTTSVSAPLTTSNPNDVIIVLVSAQSGCSKEPTISDASNLAWTLRNSVCGPDNADSWEFYAVSPSPLSSDSITATWGSGGAYTTYLEALGVSGADTSSPFDTNPSLPAIAFSQSANPSLSISTTKSNTFIIGSLFYIISGEQNSAASGSGWTTLTSADFNLLEYQIVDAAQSSVGVSFKVGDNCVSSWSILADAIQAAPITTFISTTTVTSISPTTITTTKTIESTDTVTNIVTTTVTTTSVNTVTDTETQTSVVTITREGTVTSVSTETSTEVLTTTEVKTLTQTVTQTVDPPTQVQQTITSYVTKTVTPQPTLVIKVNQTMPLQSSGVVVFPITVSYGAQTATFYGAAIPIYNLTPFDTLSYAGYYLSSTPYALTCQGTVSVTASLLGQTLSGSASCPTGAQSIDLVLK